MKRVILALLMIFTIGCAAEEVIEEPVAEVPAEVLPPAIETADPVEEPVEEPIPSTPPETEPEELPEPTEDVSDSSDWRDLTLRDIRTGEDYIISEIGKPVLLESFAVWCPKCKAQQDVIKTFHEDVGDSVVSISLGTDPNEDATKLQGHYERHGFDWYFSVSPTDYTQSLIDEFGIGVVNAPAVPVVLVCPDGEATLMRGGQKSVADLKAATEGCNA